jgi:uncharacterized damage-inducible protein DinB
MKAQLAKALAWGDAHAGFDRAVKDWPEALRGRRVRRLPHSAWQILEHLRIAQHDILDFARNAKYQALNWPDDYWPAAAAPPDAAAWDRSIAAFKRDRKAVQRLAASARLNLDRRIPHGQGQTYLREILLVLDHNAYHVGELVQLRRLLGAWPPK